MQINRRTIREGGQILILSSNNRSAAALSALSCDSSECKGNYILRLVELLLRALATRTLPVVGKVFEGDTIVLCRIVHITADRADVLAGGLLGGEIHLGQDGRYGVVEIHHTAGLEILIALGGSGWSNTRWGAG